MGRKSSAKAQARPAGSGTSSEPPPRSPARFIAIGVVVVAVIAGVFVATRSSQSEQQASSAAIQQPAPDAVPPTAKFGPHKQDRYPPLPFDPAPARSPDVVRAAYLFAAEHPEILSYVPCYCGCERMGHHGNDDCFITQRDANGNVIEWEPHGMT